MIKVSVNVQKWLDLDHFDEITEDSVKSFVRDIYNGAVNRSPVETGSYRASWRIGIGSADESVTVGGAPGAPLPKPPFYWPKGYILGQTVVISNSIKYANEIERGHSSQAPAGVLALAVASASLKAT